MLAIILLALAVCIFMQLRIMHRLKRAERNVSALAEWCDQRALIVDGEISAARSAASHAEECAERARKIASGASYTADQAVSIAEEARSPNAGFNFFGPQSPKT